MVCEKWTDSCHISKQVHHSHQLFQPSNVNQWALRELKRKKEYLPSSSPGLQPLPTVSTEETQDVKTKDTGPR